MEKSRAFISAIALSWTMPWSVKVPCYAPYAEDSDAMVLCVQQHKTTVQAQFRTRQDANDFMSTCKDCTDWQVKEIPDDKPTGGE